MSCYREKKPDIGNCVEHSPPENCAESSTRWPSAQYFRSIIQRNYHEIPGMCECSLCSCSFCSQHIFSEFHQHHLKIYTCLRKTPEEMFCFHSLAKQDTVCYTLLQ